MWIFLSDSSLSIVDKGGDGTTLLVRARHAGDIEQIFPDAKVIENAGTDYRYRAHIDRNEVAQRIAEQVRAVTYTNFKNTVKQHERHDAYMRVWEAMYDYQETEQLTMPKG